MAVTELYDSGSISGDALGEIRVREFLVTSTATSFHEAQAINEAGYKIGYLLPAPEGSNPLQQSIDQLGLSLNRPPGAKGSELLLTSYRCEKITAVPGNFNYRVILQFSTDIPAWQVRRTRETATKTVTLFHDLCGVLHNHEGESSNRDDDPEVIRPPVGCDGWYTTAYDSVTGIYKNPAPPLETWEPEMRIRRLQGVDVVRSRQTQTFSVLLYKPPWNLIDRDAYTTNRITIEDVFNEQDEWLYAGCQAEEIARDVWQATFKFVHDPDRHMEIEYRVEPGTDIPVLDEQGRPKCYASRVYPRSNWVWIGPTLHLSTL